MDATKQKWLEHFAAVGRQNNVQLILPMTSGRQIHPT